MGGGLMQLMVVNYCPGSWYHEYSIFKNFSHKDLGSDFARSKPQYEIEMGRKKKNE